MTLHPDTPPPGARPRAAWTVRALGLIALLALAGPGAGAAPAHADTDPDPGGGYIVAYRANDAEGGTVTSTHVDGDMVDEGAQVTVSATAKKDWTFVGWEVNGIEASTLNPATFTIEADTAIVGNFARNPTYESGVFSYSQPRGGTVTASVPAGSVVRFGTDVTVEATPDAGWLFAGWRINGAAAPSLANPGTLRVTEPVTVEAVFEVGPPPATGWRGGRDTHTQGDGTQLILDFDLGRGGGACGAGLPGTVTLDGAEVAIGQVGWFELTDGGVALILDTPYLDATTTGAHRVDAGLCGLSASGGEFTVNPGPSPSPSQTPSPTASGATPSPTTSGAAPSPTTSRAAPGPGDDDEGTSSSNGTGQDAATTVALAKTGSLNLMWLLLGAIAVLMISTGSLLRQYRLGDE
jgi:hypothetical protein